MLIYPLTVLLQCDPKSLLWALISLIFVQLCHNPQETAHGRVGAVLHDVRVHWRADVAMDHYLVVAALKINLKNQAKKKNQMFWTYKGSRQ